MSVRGYQLAVDWNSDGDFSDTLEDVTPYLLAEPVLTVSYGRDPSQPGAQVTAGKMTFSLFNHGRQFSPENPNSPIAGLVLPGRRVRLTCQPPPVGAQATRTVTAQITAAATVISGANSAATRTVTANITAAATRTTPAAATAVATVVSITADATVTTGAAGYSDTYSDTY